MRVLVTRPGMTKSGERKMDANELRAMQAPSKDRYKSDAKAAFRMT